MKILTPGVSPKNPNPEWRGQTAICPKCRVVVELEDGDNVQSMELNEDHTNQVFHAPCPTEYCHGDVEASVPK